ncbi:hypothetical protein RCH10_005102 [Variovorax sp. GrIS 2.14]
MSATEHHPLIEVDLAKLRPTQITAGFAEVAKKRAELANLANKARRTLLESHWFSAVLGPHGRLHIVHHHHLAMALLQEGVERVSVMLLADLSYLAPAIFWRVMEQRSWAYPFDQAGERRDHDAIPTRIPQLVDDPYRSLAGLLRGAGGYAKDTRRSPSSFGPITCGSTSRSRRSASP